MFMRELKIEVSHFDIKTPKLQHGSEIRIALISDLHSYMYRNEQEGLIALIEAQSPHIAALCGDIVDEKIRPRGAYTLCEKLTKRMPCFYVTGNHEFRRNDVPKIKEKLTSLGVRVLSNEYVKVKAAGNSFILAGADDDEGYMGHDRWMTAVKAGLLGLESESGPKILMVHKPHLVKYFSEYGFDAGLCGHTHGGQIRTPFKKRGLYASGQGLFPALSEGLYEEGGTKFIVSRGLAIEPHLPRLFNPPQLVLVTVSGG